MLCGRTVLSTGAPALAAVAAAASPEALTDEDVAAAVRDVVAARSTDSNNVRTGGSKAATEPQCDIGGIAFDIVD